MKKQILILIMMALVCGLYGTSHAYIKSIEPGSNDTSLIVEFSWSYLKDAWGRASRTFTFKWREKEPQGTWSSDKRIYSARWFTYSIPIRSSSDIETSTITGLKPGTTYEVMVDDWKGEGTTSFTELVVSAASRLEETNLDKSILTLTLNYHTYKKDITKIRDAVSVSGVPGLTLQPQRISNTEVNVELNYDGEDFDVDTRLTFTVDADAIVGYTGNAFTGWIPVYHVKELEELTGRELRQSIYWVDNSRDPIQRARFDDMNVEPLVPEARALDPTDIALDVVGGKMYWTDRETGKIQRANLDGTNVEDLLTGLENPWGIALDVVGSKMYWTDRETGKIQRANLDGTNVEDLLTELDRPQDIALDVVGGKMYWIKDDFTTGKIQRANLDGTNVEDLVIKLYQPREIVLDVVGGKMYWIDGPTSNGKIRRANLNGTSVEALLTGLKRPLGIALDVVRGKVYWTEEDKIRRANLDGTNVENFLTGLERPFRIALALPSTPSIDLVVEAVEAVPSTVEPGETFRLYATLKNQGTGESTVTTLRYYRSSDAVISTQDTQLLSANRDPLAANAMLRRYTNVTAPTTPGTYYYGACVDSVTDESNTDNNCSMAVNVTVTSPSVVSADVNEDGIVDMKDLVYISERYGQTGTTPADVNDDGVVNIDDLILVAAVLDADVAAAPSLHPITLELLSVADVELWLSQARQRDVTDPSVRKGILFLEQLLASLIPKETALLANYPNPFNPETWIPYQLAKPTDVTLRIYAVDGTMVRTLMLGYQSVGIYQGKSRAAYWDGKNGVGEPVASGVYFYTLTAGDFTATRKMLIRK